MNQKLNLIHSFDELSQVKVFLDTEVNFENHEVIILPKAFSRIGRMGMEEALEAASLLSDAGVRCYLQWDILMVESVFMATCALLKKIDWASFAGVRVQDPGALYYLKEISFSKNIHLIVDHGNHNLIGLQSWLAFWPERITRFVLSPEIPFSIVDKFINELEVELEVFGAGDILLFYTPRNLVTPLYENDQESDANTSEIRRERIEVWGTSEESPHKGFPIIENQHGTFMFNTKELFIFDERQGVERLSESSRCFFRVDYSQNPLSSEGYSALFNILLADYLAIDEQKLKTRSKDFVAKYRSKHSTRGFFKTNKTDVLFKKLKSSRLKGELDNFLGEVIDVKKKKHIGIKLRDKPVTLCLGDRIELTSPEGNIKEVVINKMSNARGDELSSAQSGQVVFISAVGGISVKTQVCFKI